MYKLWLRFELSRRKKNQEQSPDNSIVCFALIPVLYTVECSGMFA
jgi:hypothetical protein